MDIKAPDAWFQAQLLRGNGIFDKESYDVALKHIESFNVALDIGAHVGSWSIALAKIFSTVHSFEPSTVNYSYFENNSKGIENIIKYKKAVSNTHKKGFLTNKIGNNSGQWHFDDKQGQEEIETITIDELNLDNVDFVKIDVEGYELAVLNGMLKTIERCSPVFCIEMNGLSEKYYNIPDQEIKNFFKDNSYKLMQVRNKDYIFKR